MINEWRSEIDMMRLVARLAIVLVLGGLTAACFQPLYGSNSNSVDDSVRDKLAAIEIADIDGRKGTPLERLAVVLRNELIFDLNGGTQPISQIYRLNIIALGASATTVIVDVSSGRPDEQLEMAEAHFNVTEIETKKVILSDYSFANASFDIPGSGQRFARQRGQRNAEDRSVKLLAENIRNRLASYFVAGT
jgi:LPS-assembly lipoprotein